MKNYCIFLILFLSNHCMLAQSNSNTLKDIDGNTYKTVKIGEQWWMAENLKVTRYNDGKEIPLVEKNDVWANRTSPAYCWYNNNKIFSKNKKYGAFYNAYTIETNKVCPKGWHVPNIKEWEKLKSYLIANKYNHDNSSTGNKIAKSLASKNNWEFCEDKGTPGFYSNSNNLSRFTAVPCGCRLSENGKYVDKGYSAYFLSSDYKENIHGGVYNYTINNYSEDIIKEYDVKSHGYSIRCVKD